MDTVENIPKSNEGVVVVRVPESISSKEKLFEVFCGALRFPDYFGKNWNALCDCLSDLEWLADKSIIVVTHHEFPDFPYDELHAYLDVLRMSQTYWKEDGSKRLIVVFG